MRSVVKCVNGVVKAKPFPKLMVSEELGVIVLFQDSTHGVCVLPGQTNNRVGEWACNWAPRSFKDFDGVVELSNE
jgi:hypothetical protein